MNGHALPTRRPSILGRFRVILLAGVLSATAFAVQATPVALPAPLDRALSAPVAQASFCADNPGFTGHLTETSATTAVAGRITDGTVYGYISDVVDDWSCTAYYRFDGVAWNTTASGGKFDWGTIISSVSVGCNWAIGSTDYVKGNPTSDCPDSDAEYALPILLSAQRVYQADHLHDSVGDLSFIHSDCGTLYGGGDGEAESGGETGGTDPEPESFSATNVDNRPGANCDPLTIDPFATTQTVTYDKTDPVFAFTAPATGGPAKRDSTAYTVGFSATEAVSGFGGTHLWSLQRQIASIGSPGTCGTFANDTASGNLVTGTGTGAQTSLQTLAAGKCYRWVLSGSDQNGNTGTTVTSGSILVDTTAPAVNFTSPNEGTTAAQNATSYSVAWTETEAHSGIATRSLQRQRGAIVTAGTCTGVSWTNDGSAVTTASPVSATGLLNASCYRWTLTLTDTAGNSSTQTSGSLIVDTTAPTGGISVNSGATYATAAGVSLTLTSTDGQSGTSQMRFSNDNVTWTAPETYATSKSYTLPSGDGTKTVYVQFIDGAGNSSATYSDTITLDTVNPAATISINNGAASTSTTAVTLNVSASDATSGVAATAASNDNVTFTAVSGSAPSWTLTTGDGTKTVWYRISDGAGRATTVSDTITLALDTTPPGAPSQPDLVAASDSGASSTDNITNDNTPTFSGTAEANSTVRLYDGAAEVGSATATDGAWTITASVLANGFHSLTAKATDTAGNSSSSSAALSVTQDTTPPGAPSLPDLDPSSDTGTLATDNVTSDPTPTLTGTAEAGATVTVYDVTTEVGSGIATGGVWSITASALASGTHSIIARATDLAGNQGVASSALSLLIDTTAPAAPSLSDGAVPGTYRIGSSLYFRPSAGGTTTITSTATDSESGIASSTFLGLSDATGWTYDPGTVSQNPASASLTWNESAIDSTLSVLVTNGAGTESPTSMLSLVRDDVVPSATVVQPSSNTILASSSVTVSWSEPVDSGSGLADRAVVRERGTPLESDTCSGVIWTTDGPAESSPSPISATGLLDGRCYRWAITLFDRVGNQATTWSPPVLVDLVAPTATFTTPAGGEPVPGGSTSYLVTWTEADSGSGVASRSIQRESATVDGAGCPATGWAPDGPASAAVSPLRTTDLTLDTCYRWVATLVDAAGNSSATTSAVLRLGNVALASTAPSDIVFDVEPLAAITAPGTLVDRVEYLVDGAIVGDSSAPPYSLGWQSTSVANASHSLQVRLVHPDSSVELAGVVPITVDNAMPSVERLRLDSERGRITHDDAALYAVYAIATRASLPSRYQSASPSPTDFNNPSDLLGDWATLQPATQDAITDFFSQDLRGTAYNPGDNNPVGATNSQMMECNHQVNEAPWVSICWHDIAPFHIVYWITNDFHVGVPTTDSIDSTLNVTAVGNGIPDVIDRVAWSLNDARQRYESLGYRPLPDTINVTMDLPLPCGFGGCTQFIGANNGLGWLNMQFDPNLTPMDQIYTPRHELFHAVQSRYVLNYEWDSLHLWDDSTFWSEATAEWGAREVDRLSTQKDTTYRYASKLVQFLGRPQLALTKYEPPPQPQRQYGAFVLAAYLQEHFDSAFLEKIWECRASFTSLMHCLDNVAHQAPYNTTAAAILTEFSTTAYLMDFTDPDNAANWIPQLQGGEAAGAHPSDAAGQARPNVVTPAVVQSVDVTDTQQVEPGGFVVEEFTPIITTRMRLHLDVSVADDFVGQPEVNVTIVRFDHLPDQVCDIYPGTLGVSETGAGRLSGEFTLSPGAPWCEHVALIFTNTDSGLEGYYGRPRTISVTARLDPPTDVVDDFDRSATNGWATGAIGTWVTSSPTYDEYLAVASGNGTVNQVAPNASGDITVGVNRELTNPGQGPIDIVFTFTQTAASPPTDPFIDDVFYVAGDLGLSQPWAAVEVYNDPGNQSQDWRVAATDDRGTDNYLEGSFTPNPWGGSIKLRMRIDAYGTYAKIWMASSPEPTNWTSYQTRNTSVDTGWTPSWIVLQPRQTADTADSQQFTLDSVQILSGVAP